VHDDLILTQFICFEQAFSLSPLVDSIILQGILEACGILHSKDKKRDKNPRVFVPLMCEWIT
jgi:hypothetical protein